jgi:formiminotetrahydrofolate cyclodeaminase
MSAAPQDLLQLTVRDFIGQTAAKTPTPGGGSVAGAVGALAAALGEMALGFTRGKKKYAAWEPQYPHVASRLARARGMFEDLVADDVTAFTLWQSASQMPDGPQKQEASALALAAAIDVPRQAAKLAVAVLGDLRWLADKCTVLLISDLTAAAALAVAVTRLSDYNVRINAKQLTDAAAKADLTSASRADARAAAELLEEIEKITAPMFE